jgi:hypothetical protein
MDEKDLDGAYPNSFTKRITQYNFHHFLSIPKDLQPVEFNFQFAKVADLWMWSLFELK